ncbi:YiiX family permuted papain-like enzyme [Hymenobacter taeanensis]|uniref:YiiX family permuted papain-like enzyme n=1 Tax=Hymenobacter taeanensis TaxID=2735321 RepID=A0A6M6BIN5_9BACT|nr:MULTISPECIES: YiiX family permuted papain-like enzyme [Hymenobacter]QJX47748.1 YiiX family permuted papain-like enzyme [Hymenobacter taeanensis]UOQ82765.1 YiiX family permuted papain-like enzyme [Hymenobacter sp. 5414T-23]
MLRYLLPLLLLLAVSLVAYPRLHRRFTRFQQRQSAQTMVAKLAPKLRNGDLVFQTSQSAQSQAIQLATHSPYSHCGILFQRNGEWRVFEAVQPVSETSLVAWAARGKDGKVIVRRLREAETVLTPAALQRLKAAGEQYRGKSYDLYFGWSDDRIYCSELLWKMYQQATGREIGKLQTLREFDLSHPAVQAKLQERYGEHIPLDEKVISPVRMLESRELVTVN